MIYLETNGGDFMAKKGSKKKGKKSSKKGGLKVDEPEKTESE